MIFASLVFKLGADACGFLKLLLCGCMSVCAPETINNYSREIKLVKQVILLSGFYIQHLLSIFFEGMALVMNLAYLEFMLKKAKVRLY